MRWWHACGLALVIPLWSLQLGARADETREPHDSNQIAVPLLAEGELREFTIPKPIEFGVAGFLGAGNFELPLNLPVASNSQPKLVVRYRTQRVMGNCGVGCDVAFPSIRLDPVHSVIPNASGWLFIEDAAQTRLIRNGHSLFPEIGSLPYRFRQTSPNEMAGEDGYGNQLVFGGTGDTELKHPSGSTRELVLRLQRNAFGAEVEYRWSQGRIASIHWGAGDFQHRASFEWQKLAYAWPSYSVGHVNDAVIRSITIAGPKGDKKKYEFVYLEKDMLTWPRLAAVQERSIAGQDGIRVIVKTKFAEEAVARFREVQSEELSEANSQEGRIRLFRSTASGAVVPLFITEEGRILTLSRATGAFTWRDHGRFGDGKLTRYRVVDIDGDGRDDVVFIDSQQMIIARALLPDGLLGQERKFGHIPFNPYREDIDDRHYRNVVFQEARYFFADITGDGVPEAFFVDHHGNIKTSALQSGDADLSFANSLAFGEGEQLGRYVLADFNGDGISDLVLVTRDGRVLIGYADRTSLSQPVQVATALPVGEPFRVLTSDSNGDGLLDLMFSDNGRIVVLRNKGAAGPPEVITLASSGLTAGNKNSAPADANGDGITDLMSVNDDAIQLFVTGTAGLRATNVEFDASAAFLAQPPKQRMAQWHVADLNGDDRPDLLVIDGTRNFRIFLGSANEHSIMSDGILEAITSEFGGTTRITYASSGEFPHTDMPSVIPVVKRVQKTDMRGQTPGAQYQIDYEYEGGLVGAIARDFRGFRKVRAVRRVNGNVISETTTTYLQGDSPKAEPDVRSPSARFAGSPVSVRSEGQAAYWTAQEFSYLPLSGNGPFLRRVAKETSQRCDVRQPTACLGSRLEFAYDAFGNPISEKVVEGSDLVRTETREFRHDRDAWIVNILAREVVTGSAATDILAKTEYSYSPPDAQCRQLSAAVTDSVPKNVPTGIARWMTAGAKVQVHQAFDRFGNAVCTKLADNDWEVANFDATGSLLLQKKNSLNHVHSYEYYGVHVPASSALHGKLHAQIDPNRTRIEFAYDDFARLSEHSTPNCRLATPGCLAKRVRYLDWGNPDSQRVELNFPDGAFVEAHINEWGKVVRVRQTGTRDRAVVQVRSYDEVGRLSAVSLPYFEGDASPGSFSLTYDAFGNPTAVNYPDGTSRRVCYRWRSKTFVDQFGRQTRETIDGLGRTMRRETINVSNHACMDDGAAVRGRYSLVRDGLGRLLKYETPFRHIGTRKYDWLGNLVESGDPGTGRVVLSYGGHRGLLLSKVDARGARVDYQYDAIGRTIRETLAGGDGAVQARYLYRYDAAGRNAIGRLYQMASDTSLETITYSKEGHVAREQFRAGNFEFTTSYTRDRHGRVLAALFSDGKRLTYKYSGRFLEEMRLGAGRTQIGAKASLFTALGDPVDIAYSNGTVEQRLHSSVNADCGAPYRLCGVVVRNRAQQALLSQRAEFAEDGSLSSIDHGFDGVQSFAYDNFGRLHSSHWSKFPNAQMSYSYDQLDRIVASAAGGTYQYQGESESGPARIGSEIIQYDLTGNVARHGRYGLTHDAIGRLVGVETPRVRKSFVLNANGRKVREVGVPGTIVHYPTDQVTCTANHCEIELRFGETTRILTRGADAWFFYKDLNGNPSLVADREGTVVDKVYFSPFGEVLTHNRNPDPLLAGAFGFQFKRVLLDHHEQSTEQSRFFQLLDFGARAYDPALGMFVQPDVAVAERADTRFLNRYAYGNQNPTFFADTSGAMSEERQARWKGFITSTAISLSAGVLLGEGGAAVPGVREGLIVIGLSQAISAAADLKAALSDNPADMVIADAVKAVSDPTTAPAAAFALVVGFSMTGDVERSVKIAMGFKAIADIREFVRNPNAARDLAKAVDITVKEAKAFVELAKEMMEAGEKAEQIVKFVIEAIKARSESRESGRGGAQERLEFNRGGPSEGPPIDNQQFERWERYRRTGVLVPAGRTFSRDSSRQPVASAKRTLMIGRVSGNVRFEP